LSRSRVDPLLLQLQPLGEELGTDAGIANPTNLRPQGANFSQQLTYDGTVGRRRATPRIE
jgi:hypothetical protein